MASLVAPVIPETQNPIESLFRGYAAVASINNRKRALELEAQQQVENEALRSRELDIQERGQNLTYEVASAGQKALSEDKLFKLGRTKEQLQAATSLTEGIRSIKAPLGSQEWKNEAFNHLLNNIDAQQTPAYESIYEQVKPRARNTNPSQKVYNGLITNLGINKGWVNQAIENPELFTKTDSQFPDKVFIYTGDSEDAAQAIKTADGVSHPQKTYAPIKKSSWEALKNYRETYGDDDSTGKELDPATRKRIVDEIKHAHPDWDKDRIKNEAIITARRNGYEEP